MLITCLYPLCTAFLTFFQSCWGVRAQPKRQTDQIGFLTKNGRTTPLPFSAPMLRSRSSPAVVFLFSGQGPQHFNSELAVF